LNIAPILGIATIVGVFNEMDSYEYSLLIDRFETLEALTYFEIAGFFFFLFFVLFLGFKFFTKNPALPKLMIAYLWAQLAFSAVRFFWGVSIFSEYLDDTEIMIELMKNTAFPATIAAAAIWIPYFMKSRRVKATFAPPAPAYGAPSQPTHAESGGGSDVAPS
jgi:hypothetical protein